MEAMKNTGHQRGSKIICMWKVAPAYLMLNGLARGCAIDRVLLLNLNPILTLTAQITHATDKRNRS